MAGLAFSVIAPTGAAMAGTSTDAPFTKAFTTAALSAKAHHQKLSQRQRAAIAVAFAYKHIGDWYRYGAMGPHRWDCSGLAGGAWKSAGIKIPRVTTAIYRHGYKRVSRSHLQPGDLLFFYHVGHVMIYVGHGYAIHAPHTGQKVKKIKLNKYEWRYFNGAVRPGA